MPYYLTRFSYTPATWAKLIENKNKEIIRLNGIYRKILADAGVTLFEGHAEVVDAHTVAVDGKRITAKYILVAVGSWPTVPKSRP